MPMTVSPFRTEPLTDFAQPAGRQAMEQAIRGVGAELGREFPLLIDGREVRSGATFRSINPSQADQTVAVVQQGTGDHVEQAVQAALRAYESWQRVPAEERCALLLRAAAILRHRRLRAAAWMSFEVGKNWTEADADVAEALDFLEYYARESLRYAHGPALPPLAGEMSEYQYIPLGVVAVISPWNFPLAIPTGMTIGAIASGNTVVMKPASDSVATAYQVVDALREAGLPPGVLNVIPGSGGVVGEALASHPKVRMIAFTGSKEVGTHLFERAAKTPPGQIWLKRIIAEMGGKNAIIVDDEADLDAATAGVIASAYGYQGQKCSAGSRVVATPRAYGRLTEMIVERARALEIGPGPENFPAGPVINAAAERKILEYVEVGRREGRLATGGGRARDGGFYVAPTVFVDVAPDARIAQEEIFGPVVAAIPARDFDDALRIANGTAFGLTGSVYTLNPEKLAKARREFMCGNLYLNRKSTGAMVGTHPFGGFNMSGTDSKAGGPDYLLNFLQPKVVAYRYI
ncbi:MAG TPA: L-glutamate gamma-semialdehyde dehydrogenase [bacterium]|nr:L-glutamate gamma-semialdehyde dehydrogenase [bacterium]